MNKNAILVNITSLKGHHGCSLVNRRIRELAHESGINLVSFIPLDPKFQDHAPKVFDLVIVNGEGTLHHDTKGSRLIGQVAAWANKLDKPSALINTVCESIPQETAQQLRLFSQVYARDAKSLGEFNRLGIQAALVPDLTLSWNPGPVMPSGKRLYITDSTVRQFNQELHRLAKSIPDARFLPLIAGPEWCQCSLSDNIKNRLLFNVKQALAYLAPPSLWRDRYRCAIPEFTDFVQTLLSDASLLIAGRFHSVCLAMDLEIPFLAIRSNTWKVESLLEEAGLVSRLVEPSCLHTIASRPLNEFAYTPEELQNIRRYRSIAQQKSREMFMAIANIE
jgi:polysaccharide pyruvyl transferase WcaK-like protein